MWLNWSYKELRHAAYVYVTSHTVPNNKNKKEFVASVATFLSSLKYSDESLTDHSPQ